MAHGGFLTRLKLLLSKNRLGELLVLQGKLSPKDLQTALRTHRKENKQLGRFLIDSKMVSRKTLYTTLVEQWGLRILAAGMSFMLMMSATSKSSEAASIKDIPPAFKLASTANAAFKPMNGAFPALFGSSEKRSYNLDPFTKWTGMFERFDKAVQSTDGQRFMAQWKAELQPLQGQSIGNMARTVNSMVNDYRYITDDKNWGKTDYWATPVEFFVRGGDCEDFAIAKYVSLRALGVPEERMRIAIVHDKQKNIPHAVLIVYTDGDALILDNQTNTVRSSAQVNRYRPIFSINRTAWWLHTAPGQTVLASAK